jgi:hypothetical protein
MSTALLLFPRMPANLQNNETIEIRREKKKIWNHIRSKWLEETPEELIALAA